MVFLKRSYCLGNVTLILLTTISLPKHNYSHLKADLNRNQIFFFRYNQTIEADIQKKFVKETQYQPSFKLSKL